MCEVHIRLMSDKISVTLDELMHKYLLHRAVVKTIKKTIENYNTYILETVTLSALLQNITYQYTTALQSNTEFCTLEKIITSFILYYTLRYIFIFILDKDFHVQYTDLVFNFGCLYNVHIKPT